MYYVMPEMLTDAVGILSPYMGKYGRKVVISCLLVRVHSQSQGRVSTAP